MNFKFKTSHFLAVILLSALAAMIPASAVADTSQAYLKPSSSAVPLDSELSVDVLADSASPVNALDLEISYPSDKVAFVDSDTAHSIVSFWQGGGVLMLSKGHLSLSGGMLSPFQGTDGLVAKLHFRALRSGQAELSFEKSNLYLSDGKGTKNSINSAPITLSISSNAPATELPSVPIDTTPPSLKVSLIKDPVSGNYLIFYAPSGTGSGIRIIEMRTQAWWNWGDWQEITGNPIVFPARAWGVEIRIRNNNGEEAAQFIAAPFPYLKAFIIISVCIILILILLYNKRRRMS